MKFDVAIIGGGLAGLICGITLQKQGKQCVVINNGQAAIDFSSGSMDLLSHLPDGQKVRSFSQGFLELAKQSPAHPYLLFGQEKVIEKAQQFEQLAVKIGLALQGSTLQNHYRVTPLGGLYTTWLSAITVPQLAWEDSRFPHQHIAILGIEGYHDFQPQLLADNLIQNPQFAGCKITTGYLNIPELDRLRSNAREFRSINIAQLLEHKLAFSDLVEEIKQASAGASAVFLPACFGVDDGRFLQHLTQACALDLYELPTLPPSLLGMRQHKTLRQEFEQVGGIMLNGDKALNGIFEGNRVTRLYTRLHQEEGIAADHFVLASGSFFSNGLVADFERIIEPVFKADIIGLDNLNERNRLSWTATRFSSSQPYQSAGVAINAHCQVKKCGEFIENLYAVGNVIGGYNALQLGCGSGISVVTALIAAEQILSA